MPQRTDRRTPEELAFAYAFGSRKDVFVEGAEDRGIVQAYLAKHTEPHRCDVYEIGEVEISDAQLMAAGLEVGQRGRVLWFAKFLADRSATAQARAFLIIDRDQDCVDGKCYPIRTLHVTDYCCMEAYAGCDAGLSAILSGYQRVALVGSKFMQRLRKSLTALFTIRGVLHRLGGGHKLIEFNGHFDHRPDGPRFLVQSYVDALLNRNRLWAQRAAFYSALRNCFRLTRKLDRRQTMNGHDLVELIGLWLANTPPRPPKHATHPESVRAVLRAVMVGLPLDTYSLFKKLDDFIWRW